MEWIEKRISELYVSSSGLSKPANQFGFGYPFLSYKEIFNHYYAPDEGSDSEAGMMVIDPKLDTLVKIVGGIIGDEATDMYNTLRYGMPKVTIMEKDKIWL